MTDEQIESMANACGLYGVRKAVVQCVRELLKAHPDHSGDGGEKKACRELTDDDMDRITKLSEQLEFGQLGFHEFCETIIRDFGIAAPVSQEGDERATGVLPDKELLVIWDQSTDEVDGPSLVEGSMTAWILAYGRAVRRAALASNKAAAVAARPTDDVLWDQTLTERDNYHEWADKLANAIAEHFGIEIGEHSSANNPWSVALDTLENMVAPIAQAWRTTEPSVCVPMTEDPGVAALWREAGFDVIDLFESMPVAAAVAVGEPIPWIAHWAGSNPHKGWSIRSGRDEVIWFGETVSSETVEGIVLAHNNCFDCEGGGCVMNCSGLRTPAPIASSLSDRDIQEAALEWQCDPAFDHFVFHENELVEYVRGILARVHPAASGAEVLEQAAAICENMSCRPEFEPEIQDRMLRAAAKSIRALKDKP